MANHKTIAEIIAMAQADELFEPEVLSLEDEEESDGVADSKESR